MNKIHFQNVIPAPLAHIDQLRSDIWLNDFYFEKGKFYWVAAHSGKGKTTFQHIIYGLRKDYNGKVCFHYNDKELIVDKIGMNEWTSIRKENLSLVFQDLKLFESMSVWENLLLKNALNSFKTEDQILEMMKSLDVDQIMDKKINEISFGQQQRVAILRALCQPFDFLLLDEPFSHLDSLNIEKCCTLIQEECEIQQAALIMISLEEKYNLNYDYDYQL